MTFLPTYQTPTSFPLVTVKDTADQIRATQALTSLANKVLNDGTADATSDDQEWFSIVAQMSDCPSASASGTSGSCQIADACTYKDPFRQPFAYSSVPITTTSYDPSRPNDFTMYPHFALSYSEPPYSLYPTATPLEGHPSNLDFTEQGPVYAPEVYGFYAEPPQEPWSWVREPHDYPPPCNPYLMQVDPQVSFPVNGELYTPVDAPNFPLSAPPATRQVSRSTSPQTTQPASSSTLSPYSSSAPSTPAPHPHEPVPLHHPRPRRPISVRDIPVTWHPPPPPSPVEKYGDFAHAHVGGCGHEDSCLSSTSLLCQPVSNAVLLEAGRPYSSGTEGAYEGGSFDHMSLADILSSFSHDDMVSPDSQDSCGFGY